jgi:hypothetical protein
MAYGEVINSLSHLLPYAWSADTRKEDEDVCDRRQLVWWSQVRVEVKK